MPSRFNSLLHEAPRGRHFCQIHHSSESLDHAVLEFARAGIERGEGVALLLSAQRRSTLEELMREAGRPVEALIVSGQLQIADTDEVREQCERDGVPDWALFSELFDAHIARFHEAGFRRVRLYGEISDGLWKTDPARALAFEELALRISSERNLPIFCGYHIDALSIENTALPIQELGRVHTDVPASDDDEALRLALDAASSDVLGTPLSAMLSSTGNARHPGEHRLPLARRIVLWLRRTMPEALPRVLQRARHHYGKP